MSFDFLYTAVAWVLLRWHQLVIAVGIPTGNGANWALSIIFLVVTARLLLFPFFIKQVHYQRRLQVMQPKIQQIREKYKNHRQTMQQEMLKLQQAEGFNPLTGCLPTLLQIPVFISLYHVLRHLANSVNLSVGSGDPKLTLYTFSAHQTHSAATAKLFGAPLAASLRSSADTIAHLGGDLSTTRIVTIALVLVSAAATYATQILSRHGEQAQPAGTAATVQKLMLYVAPTSVLVSGLIFPLGVLLYWLTSNTCTLVQQAYINRFHPPAPPASATAASPPRPPEPDSDHTSGPAGRAPRVGQHASRPRRRVNPPRRRTANKRRRRKLRRLHRPTPCATRVPVPISGQGHLTPLAAHPARSTATPG